MPAAAKSSAPRRPVRRAAPATATKLSAASYLADNGTVKLDDVAATLRLSKGQLAESAGLRRDVLQKASRRDSPKAQSRMREMLEILQRVQDWAGSAAQALAWYRAEPLPAFGGRTAESLVQSGEAKAVRDYLDHVARGGYA
ncbi:MAG: MbcA/ParS/Xre antitoxin family protein [Parcubacteria group bacterium]